MEGDHFGFFCRLAYRELESYRMRSRCDLPPFRRLKAGRKVLSTAGESPTLTHSDAVGLSFLGSWNIARSTFAELCPALNPPEQLLAVCCVVVWLL